jgi:hypothetical protein
MENINLSDKLFHAVKPNLPSWVFWSCSRDEYLAKSYDVMKEKLRLIFESNFIMCQRDLDKLSVNYYPHHMNLNGHNNVSLSRHYSERNNDSNYPGHIVNENSDNAWDDYPFNYPAFVFKKSILKENALELNCSRMLLELQVKGSIDLKKAVALSIPIHYSVAPFFNDDDDIDINSALNDYQRNRYKYMMLKYLLVLTKQYHVDLPIIYIDNGVPYRENPEYDEIIKKLM